MTSLPVLVPPLVAIPAGWNASVIKSHGGDRDPAKQYARYTCSLPPDELVLGGSSAYSTLFSSDASPENFVKRFLEMDTDILLSTSAKEHDLAKSLEIMLDAKREPPGWLSENYPQELVKVNGTWMGLRDAENKIGEKIAASQNRYPSSFSWMGKAGAACAWFRKASKIMDDFRDYTCCLAGGNGVHEANAWRIALFQMNASTSVKAKMLDFRSTIHHAIRDCNFHNFNISADGHTIIRALNSTITKDFARPLWNFMEQKCPGYVTNAWFTRKTKYDFFNLHAKKKKKDEEADAYVTTHDHATFESTRVNVSDVCPYIWDPEHDWSAAQLNWDLPHPYPGPEGAKYAVGNVMEFAHLHEKKKRK